MTRAVIGLAACLAWGGDGAAGPEDLKGFGGAWRTTFGVVNLAQEGRTVTGSFGAGGRFPIKGTADGNKLTMEYDEGNAKGDATFTLEPSGLAYEGTFQVRGGRRGTWNGWRPDPKAASAPSGKFAGAWLTDFGLMSLEQEGAKVKGRYALRGTSGVEGTAAGRHLEFRYKNPLGGGPAWFDLAEDGRSLLGAGGGDNSMSWYAWRGRKADEYARHAKLVAGQLVDGSTDGLLTYTVRAPEGYKPGDGKTRPAVLLLHGSNMSGRAYVATVASAWPDIAGEYILLGINGEQPSNLARDNPQFNYTYQNWMGKSTYKGFPGTDRESPALVHEAMEELRKVYPIGSYLAGGHSQGGFLAYCLLMHYPESVAGVFPISGGLLIQCAPSAFDDGPLKKAQRAVPLAIVHGKSDPFVSYDMAESSLELFRDAGWPALRLFDDDRAGHMFALLPVGKAIRWLETLASDDPAKLVGFGEARLKEDGVRDAIAAARKAKGLEPDEATRARLAKLSQAIDAKAEPGAKRWLAEIRANKDGSWADGFLAYRDTYEFADAAGATMAAFETLRASQEGPAKAALGEAQGLFNRGRRDEGFAKCKEVAARYYASTSYRTAKQWLKEQK